MPSIEHIASLIAGRRRRRNLNASLETLLLLEYFAQNMDDEDIQYNISRHSAKEIIAADYCNLSSNDFRQRDLLYACCIRLPSYGIAHGSARSEPDAEARMAAAAYLNALSASESKMLAESAVNANQLKAVMLIDALAGKMHCRFDAGEGTSHLLTRLAEAYKTRRQGMLESFSRIASRIKYPLLALTAASSLAFAVFSGIDCYTDYKARDIYGYEEKLETLAECGKYLIADEYKKAFECNDSLLKSAQGNGHYYNASVRVLSEGLAERIQQDMLDEYSLRLKNAEAELALRHYDAALALCNGVEEQLMNASYFEKGEEVIKKASELEERIKAEKEAAIPNTSSGFFGALGDYIASGYKRLHGFFMALGLGETGSDIAASLLLFLPLYGFARRMRKRKSPV